MQCEEKDQHLVKNDGEMSTIRMQEIALHYVVLNDVCVWFEFKSVDKENPVHFRSLGIRM